MKPDTYRPAGTHLLADLHGIEPGLLLDPDAIDALLRAAATAAGARILHSQFHTFGEALGVTGVVLLAESHISIHTWPEYGFAAGARILHSQFYTFGEALGVTGVVLLAESHISIHTWPEYGFAAADIFMCGSAAPQLALAVIEQALQPRSRVVQTIARGGAIGTEPTAPRPIGATA